MNRKHDTTPFTYPEGTKEAVSRPNRRFGWDWQGTLADGIACILLSTAVAFGLFAFTELEYGLWDSLGYAAIAAIAVCLCRIRWWVFPALLGAMAGGFALFHAIAGTLREAAAHAVGIGGWLLSGAYYSELYTTPFTLGLFQFLLVLLCAAAILPLIRRAVLLPVAAALTLGVVLACHLLARSDLATSLALWAAGLVILLPGFYAGRVAKSHGGADISPSRMKAVAIPGVLLALLLAMALTPEDTSHWQSRSLNNLIADIATLFRGPGSSGPWSASNFSLEALGFQAETGRLGGPVVLTDRDTLSVTSLVPVYLKGTVSDTYTGLGWENRYSDGDYRYESLLFRSGRREAFDLDRPLGGYRARGLYQSLTREIDVSIRHEVNTYTTLFTAGRPSDIRLSGSLYDTEFYFNLRSELYMYLRMPSLYGIELETRVWDWNNPEFDDTFRRLEQLALSRSDSRYDALLERYTALPDTLPDSVYDAVAALTAELDSPYDKATCIRDWLAQTATYTLNPQLPPEDADFVAYFLETGEGYCTYYASAMAVLARCAGIPSRYVQGFALERHPSGEENRYMANGRTAHAWAELYFHGIGWVEFDPLLWDVDAPLNPREELPEPEQVETPLTPEPEPEPSTEPDFPYESVVPENTLSEAAAPRSRLLPVLLAAMAVLVLLALLRLGFAWAMNSKLRAYASNRVFRKYPVPADALSYYYTDILRQLALLDLAPRPGETLSTFPGRVDRRLALEGCSLEAIAQPLTRMYFAGQAPSRSDAELARDYHQRLEHLLMERLGR
ncbi:transglutaminase-like domain-containing protein, partial [Ruminococcaceae bacterium OttesenSCG-928-L11]|nr:transglutaminase-like domain-containing protein [Ruminococcaceae bacterium OttesenSCG-928-L11]